MLKDAEIVLTAPVRTAIGAFNGSLKGGPATDLGACVVKEILRRTGCLRRRWSLPFSASNSSATRDRFLENRHAPLHQ